MPAGGQQMFVPDRRGSRLEHYSFVVAADRRNHRLLLRASPEIVGQFLNITPAGLGYRLISGWNIAAAGWTHCLEAPSLPDASARELADLLSEVITLPSLPSVQVSVAMDWYKVPAEGVAPEDWRNTPDGQLLFGRPCRLSLALWIIHHDKPRFFQSEPPREVIQPGELAKELGRLVRLGMLEEERPDGERRVYYTRTDSRLWKIIEAVSESVAPN